LDSTNTKNMNRTLALLFLAGVALAAPEKPSDGAQKTSVVVPAVAVAPKLGALQSAAEERRERIFDLLFTSKQFRQDVGIPIVAVGSLAVLANIAVIIMILLTLFGVVEITQLHYSDNVGSIDGPFGSRVQSILKDNPQALNDLTRYVLPSLAPKIFPDNDKAFEVADLASNAKGTAISNIYGVDGPLYFAHLAPQNGKEATVVAGAIEGLKTSTDYVMDVHQSGDVSNGCLNVGEKFTEFNAEEFRTDSKGRAVILMHEPTLSLRGPTGVMGRSLVVREKEGGSNAFCGVIINN